MRWIALTFLLLTAGCTTFSTPNPISATTVFELRAGYDAAFLVPAANYRRMPLCEVAPAPCSERAIVEKLQQADLVAEVALDAAEDFVRNHPTLNASTVTSVAQAAVNAAIVIGGRQ